MRTPEFLGGALLLGVLVACQPTSTISSDGDAPTDATGTDAAVSTDGVTSGIDAGSTVDVPGLDAPSPDAPPSDRGVLSSDAFDVASEPMPAACEDLSLPTPPETNCYRNQQYVGRAATWTGGACSTGSYYCRVGTGSGFNPGCCLVGTDCVSYDNPSSTSGVSTGCIPGGAHQCGTGAYYCGHAYACVPGTRLCCPPGVTCHTCATPPAWTPRSYGTAVAVTATVASGDGGTRDLAAYGELLGGVIDGRYLAGTSRHVTRMVDAGRYEIEDWFDLAIYDHATRTWSALPSERMSEAGGYSTVVVDGEYWVLEAHGTTAARWHRFSLATRTWSAPTTTTLAAAFGSVGAGKFARVGNYVVGGSAVGLQQYDLARGTWRALVSPRADFPALNPTFVFAAGGSIYLSLYPEGGVGAAFYAYTPDTGTWTALSPSLRIPRAAMGDLILVEGADSSGRSTYHVYDTTRRETRDIVIGPEVGPVTSLRTLNAVWTGTLLVMENLLYDPLTERWGIALGPSVSGASFFGPAFGGSLWYRTVSGSTTTLSEYTPPEHLLRACP